MFSAHGYLRLAFCLATGVMPLVFGGDAADADATKDARDRMPPAITGITRVLLRHRADALFCITSFAKAEDAPPVGTALVVLDNGEALRYRIDGKNSFAVLQGKGQIEKADLDALRELASKPPDPTGQSERSLNGLFPDDREICRFILLSSRSSSGGSSHIAYDLLAQPPPVLAAKKLLEKAAPAPAPPAEQKP